MSGASARTSRTIRAKPQDVYKAFVDPDSLVAWLPPAHESDARIGGGYLMSLFYPPTERVFRGKTADREDRVTGKTEDNENGSRLSLEQPARRFA